MDWNILDNAKTLGELIEKSNNSPQIIFKHSTRCSISTLVLNRISSKNIDKNYYIIDIMSHRDISNEIASRFNIIHQSPQLLIIRKGACEYNTSHLGISSSWISKNIDILENK